MDGNFALLVDPATGLVLEAGPALEHWLGQAEGSLVGRPLSQWVKDPTRQDLHRALAVAMRGLEPRRFRVVFAGREGQSLPADVVVSPQPGRRGFNLLQIHVKQASPRPSDVSERLSA